MTSKKKRIYTALVALFLMFWPIYFALVTRMTDITTKQSLDRMLDTASSQIEKGIHYHVRDFQFYLSEQAADYIDTREDAFAVLRSMQEREDQNISYLLTLKNGESYFQNGAAAGMLFSEYDVASARANGSLIIDIGKQTNSQSFVAILIPSVSNEEYFFARMETADAFGEALIAELSLPTEYMALYNGQGERLETLSGDPTDVDEPVQQGVLSYLANPRSDGMRKGKGAGEYDVFLPVTAPSGWVLGGRLDASQVFPLYFGMYRSFVFTFFTWLILAAAVVALDILNDREKKRRMQQARCTDSLTGLPNGNCMGYHMDQFFRDHPRTDYKLVCLDVVAFHRFNNLYGHNMGDALLCTIANILRQHTECPSRSSGDIFVFLTRKEDDLHGIMTKWLYEGVENDLGKSHTKMLSFNFGIYPIPDDQLTLRELYDGALLALKEAKKTPDHNVAYYDHRLQRQADFQRSVEMNMLYAIPKDEFQVYIQPKFSTDFEECCGGEALVRWSSNQMGFLRPESFIPIFEHNGFIIEVDFFMLENALKTLQRHKDEGISLYPLSVNQSKTTITFPNYLERIQELVRRYDVPLTYLELEITESVLEGDDVSIIPILNQVKAMGFIIAMDDFGSGFSSLNTLVDFPVDVLKIDKEFLKASDHSVKSKKIIRSVVNMARDLDMSVVCEGVETSSQFQFLREAGCNVVQGYYFSKPIPREEYEQRYVVAAESPH